MSYSLNAQVREDIKGVQKLRDKKLIPAVLYGFKVENQNLQISLRDFQKLYEQAGESQVVDLNLGKGDPVHVIIREVQIDPVRRDPIHVDFYAIDVNNPIEVDIPLHFVGEAPAVKIGGGSLIKGMDRIKIKTLPKDLVKFIEVPIDLLQTFDNVIHVKDIKIKESWELLNDPHEAVAMVSAPRVVEEDKPAVAEGATEGEADKPAEGAGKAEGAAAADKEQPVKG